MRLTLGVFAAVAVLSLLALGLVMLLLALLRALVTGQRPAAVTAFSRFRQFSGQQMAGRWGGARNAAEEAEASPVRAGAEHVSVPTPSHGWKAALPGPVAVKVGVEMHETPPTVMVAPWTKR